MKKKNILASCAVTGLLLSALVACGGNNQSSAKPESKPTSETTPSSEVAPASDPKSEAPASTPAGDSTPAPVATPIKVFSSDDVKAGLSDASTKEVKDETGDVKFTAYKIGSNKSFTLKWTPTADQAGKIALNLILTNKVGNAAAAYFWYQGETSTSAKTRLDIDGTALATPSENPNFNAMAGGESNVVASDVDDDGALANPISFKVAEYDVVAGQENTITVTYLGGGYSFYYVGAEIFKA